MNLDCVMQPGPILSVVWFLLVCGGIAHPADVLADDTEESSPVLRVVFFTPLDVEPPEGVAERLKDSVEYARAFYGKWMKHWGYESDNPIPIELNDGMPKILFVKGRFKEASGRYRQLGFQPEVIEAACDKYDIDPRGQVWWIFTYRGPERRGFRGGGNAMRGGTSTAIYDPEAGTLKIDIELGSSDAPSNSKASIHELGHALGLPHIGPLQNDKLGNSLMGPVVRAYRGRYPKESRVYLTEASAAMLWKHPLFSGTSKDRDVTPRLEIADFRAKHESPDNRLVVTGKVVSDHTAHSVVIANESNATRSDYWRKCFAGRVKKDGTFEIMVDELDQTDGFLRIVACFNNGAVVGSNGVGMQSGFAKQYHITDGTFKFDDSWSDQKPSARPRGKERPGLKRRPVRR